MKYLIVLMVFIFISCTPIVEPQKPIPSDNTTLEVKSSIIEPWPDNMLEFHKAMYFATMAMRPDLRQKYQPINLYNICSCIVDILQSTYTYEEYRKKFTGANSLAPDAQQEVYGISYKCSQEEVHLMQQQMLNPDVKDAI